MVFTKKNWKWATAVAATLVTPLSALATNGMNLEGYGPIATGMGGASMAYDNGAAAVMNNPATLGLMSEGSRFDGALGLLGPNITSKMNGQPDAESSADAFYMPAFGWVRRNGSMAYGVGMFGQGGMGTEYAGDSFLAAGSGETVRSEVSVGRLIAPLVFQVAPNINIGGSLDFVWAGMDLKMALAGSQFGDMMPTGSQSNGTVSGSMVNTFGGALSGGMLTGVNWARFDFSNGSDFTGEAKGEGFAGKLGGTFKVSDQLTLGVTYHSKTALSDLDTDNAKVSMNVVGPATGGTPMTVNVTGKIEVKDFEWPQMFAFGAAFNASDALMLVADYKWIDWSDSMKNFKMTFTADQTQSDPLAAGFGLGGTSMDAVLYQDWDDQNVIMLGAAYKMSDEFTLRGGVNLADNPVPDQYVNPLFPAIIKTHLMLGAGFGLSKVSTINASLTYAPEVEVTNPGSPAVGDEVTMTHSQTNAQIMYSYRF